MLFLLELVLLIKPTRKLLGVVTAFTLGHSVSLSLAALEWVRIPAAPVEILIAVTIYMLGLELVQSTEKKVGIITRIPWVGTAFFGFLHGLGFAGALVEVGLPPGQVLSALFAFNVGVELGQVLFLIPVVAVVTMLGPHATTWFLRGRAIIAHGIGGLAAYWVIEGFARLIA